MSLEPLESAQHSLDTLRKVINWNTEIRRISTGMA